MPLRMGTSAQYWVFYKADGVCQLIQGAGGEFDTVRNGNWVTEGVVGPYSWIMPDTAVFCNCAGVRVEVILDSYTQHAQESQMAPLDCYSVLTPSIDESCRVLVYTKDDWGCDNLSFGAVLLDFISPGAAAYIDLEVRLAGL